MKINVLNIVALNEITWYNSQETQEKLKNLPLKTQWVLRKNMQKIQPIAKEFGDFRSELDKKRQEEWFVEGNGKCDKVTNDNGEEVLQIKEEYLEEFSANDEKLNEQIREIAFEETKDIEVTEIVLEDIVAQSDEHEAGLTIEDMEMLAIFEESEEEDNEE